MLKVLVVITRGEPGGAQVHVLDLVTGLRSSVDFHVAIGDDEFLCQELRALGIPVTVVPELQRSVSPLTDVRALVSLRTLIARVRPDIVHTHSTKAGLLGRWAAASRGVPAVHTAHSWSFSDGIAWSRKALAIPVEAVTARVTRRFIVVSEADREVSTRYGVAREEQLRVVHNGVADVAERSVPDEAGPPVIVMVARMAPPKDQVGLLRALAQVDAPWRVRLVGDGPARPAVEAAVGALGIGDRVELLGIRADVPVILAGAQIGVLVSRQEGFPLAVLEAMRAGLPVVASDVGGVREAVVPEVTGFLVPRDDRPALTTALRRLVVSPALRRSLGDAGRRAYKERFTVEKMLATTLDVYTGMRT